jgi:prevent-host-death family protein
MMRKKAGPGSAKKKPRKVAGRGTGRRTPIRLRRTLHRVSATQLRRKLGYYLDRVERGKWLQILHYGRTAGVLISWQDYQQLLG